LILLSAHAGGNRLKNPRAARNFSLAGNTDEQIKEAQALTAAGKPRQLMLIPAWWWVGHLGAYISRPAYQRAGSSRERQANPMPGAFYSRRSGAKRKYPAERFKENCAGPCEVVIVPNCDHFYVGAEERVSKIVTDWLVETLR
jgi:hypothetical protein